MDGAIYNPHGKVILRYWQPVPKLIRINEHDYYFDSQHGVSLGFVDEADVPAALSHMGGCCGGKRKVISLATQVLYDHWLDGQGGR